MEENFSELTNKQLTALNVDLILVGLVICHHVHSIRISLQAEPDFILVEERQTGNKGCGLFFNIVAARSRSMGPVTHLQKANG